VAGQGTTDNLMDYTTGNKTILYKHQWDLVHDPETMLFAGREDADEVLEQDPDRNLGLRINNLAVSLGLQLGKDVFAIIHSIDCPQIDTDAKTQEILINKERVAIEGRYTPIAFQMIPERNDQGRFYKINTVILFQINGSDSIGFHSKIEFSNVLPSQVKYTPFLGVLTTEKLIECNEQLQSLDQFVCKTGTSLYEQLLEDNYQGFYIVQLLKAVHTCLIQTESKNNSQKFGDRFYSEIIEKNAGNTDLKQLREVSDLFNEIADILFKNQNYETWNEVKEFFHATYSIPDKSSYASYLERLQYFIDDFKAKQRLLADLSDRESIVTIITILKDNELKLLPMKLRSKALNILASKKLRDAIRLSGDNEENLVLRLIANVNQNEIPLLLDELRKGDLLNTLDKEFNDFITIADDNYTSFLDIIDKYALEQNHIEYSNKDEWLAKLFEKDQSFDLTGMLNGRKYISASKVLEDGKVQLTLTKIKNITFEWKLSFGELNRVENRETENEVISIDFDSPVSLYHNAFLKGVDVSKRHQYEIVTALRLHYYLQSHEDAVTKQGIWTTIDIVTLAAGVGEITAGAKSVLRLALAIANTASSTTSLLSTATEKYLIDEYGQDGVDYVNAMHRISAVLGVADMGYSGYKLIERMLLTDLATVGRFFERNGRKLLQENQTKEIAENTKYLVDNLSDEIRLIVRNSENTSRLIEDFLVAKKLKGSQIETLLLRATNNKSEVLTKLMLWEKSPNVDALCKLLNDNLAKYSKLTDEMIANPELIDYFAKAFGNYNWYSALGIKRQINNRRIGSPAFCEMIGDIEVTYAKGLKGKLKTIGLDEAQGVHLGDIFDYNMEQYVSSFWRTGKEPNLPDVVINRLTELQKRGYELVIKPKVSISGNNPVPDMLFIKFDKQKNTFDFTDCIYIDNKYSPSINDDFDIIINQIKP
jgi:hypothetical protein